MRPVPSCNVPNASFPCTRRSMSRPATVTMSPVSVPGGSSGYFVWMSPVEAVGSKRYGGTMLMSTVLSQARSLVLLEDEAEALQGEPRLHVLDGLGERRHELGEVAGADDLGIADLAADAIDDTVDHRPDA